MNLNSVLDLIQDVTDAHAGISNFHYGFVGRDFILSEVLEGSGYEAVATVVSHTYDQDNLRETIVIDLGVFTEAPDESVVDNTGYDNWGIQEFDTANVTLLNILEYMKVTQQQDYEINWADSISAGPATGYDVLGSSTNVSFTYDRELSSNNIPVAPPTGEIRVITGDPASGVDALISLEGFYTYYQQNQLRYQWQRDGVDINGETSSEISFTRAADTTGDYRVIVTAADRGTQVISNVITVV